MLLLKCLQTYKPYGSVGGYYRTEILYINLPSQAAYKEWSETKYGKCKRQPMYRDTEKGAVRVGTVFKFRDDLEKCWREDWVEMFKNAVE